ncbi:MAG: ArsR family transcriptional regulator [Anaerolineales bacterium]|nr:ArsR family transcriptional regulator [Anaerolineales bacterium]HMR98512.1 ArsR family transcriptional regulator [Anaerolineales bacterium]HNQ96241.1 ArsR family transcriptional regulator [Anaerolineales bacterium]
MAVTTARHKILAYMMKYRISSAREISRGLKMSAATVRHHLRVLLSDGRLESASARVRPSRGRPEKAYSIPLAALGDNLPALSEALLAEAGRTVRIEALVKRLADESDLKSQPVAKRLNLVVERLNQMNYHARWEAGSEGPRVIFSHCPYMAIVAKHPELCKMDALLLEKLMGTSAEPLTTIREENSSCVFVMRR